MSCDKATKEFTQIVDVCRTVQQYFPLHSKERNEIFNLLLLVNSKQPLYTAAGYFTVNRSTLFGLLSVITTYFIILVQFI